jgi:hypothetical protein
MIVQLFAPPFAAPVYFPDIDAEELAREDTGIWQVFLQRTLPIHEFPDYSAASAYASSGAQVHTRLRSP